MAQQRGRLPHARFGRSRHHHGDAIEYIKEHGHDVQVFKGWKQVSAGTMTPNEYDQAMGDLVGYLQWMAEPAQNSRVRIGVWVMLFLGVFTVIAWRLNAAYWKDES